MKTPPPLSGYAALYVMCASHTRMFSRSQFQTPDSRTSEADLQHPAFREMAHRVCPARSAKLNWMNVIGKMTRIAIPFC
jgi:hypothetical protein